VNGRFGAAILTYRCPRLLKVSRIQHDTQALAQRPPFATQKADTFTARYWTPSFLLRDHFDNLSSVRHFLASVLVIHGRQDSVNPWKQGQRLAAASPRSTFKLYDCGHVCWDPELLPFWQDVMPFLLAAGIVAHV
jgi:pimeloyl-ACP methyl ester carboxylesterase